jgi:hypothetical protein
VWVPVSIHQAPDLTQSANQDTSGNCDPSFKLPYLTEEPNWMCKLIKKYWKATSTAVSRSTSDRGHDLSSGSTNVTQVRVLAWVSRQKGLVETDANGSARSRRGMSLRLVSRVCYPRCSVLNSFNSISRLVTPATTSTRLTCSSTTPMPVHRSLMRRPVRSAGWLLCAFVAVLPGAS